MPRRRYMIELAPKSWDARGCCQNTNGGMYVSLAHARRDLPLVMRARGTQARIFDRDTGRYVG